MSETSNRRTTVYRAFDDEGALLYVGITNTRGRRFGEHSDQSEHWWLRCADIRLTHFPCREEALAAEKWHIKHHRPEWNTIHNRGEFAHAPGERCACPEPKPSLDEEGVALVEFCGMDFEQIARMRETQRLIRELFESEGLTEDDHLRMSIGLLFGGPSTEELKRFPRSWAFLLKMRELRALNDVPELEGAVNGR